MRFGEIIYFKTLKFKDGAVDKKENRPCIFLFEEKINDVEYVYSIPITSSLGIFNDKSRNYVLIPETVYNYHKLSFANVKGVVRNKKSDATTCNFCLTSKTMMIIVRRLIEKSKDRKIITKMKEILENNYQPNTGSSPSM